MLISVLVILPGTIVYVVSSIFVFQIAFFFWSFSAGSPNSDVSSLEYFLILPMFPLLAGVIGLVTLWCAVLDAPDAIWKDLSSLPPKIRIVFIFGLVILMGMSIFIFLRGTPPSITSFGIRSKILGYSILLLPIVSIRHIIRLLKAKADPKGTTGKTEEETPL